MIGRLEKVGMEEGKCLTVEVRENIEDRVKEDKGLLLAGGDRSKTG